tara:strand:+ start:279 stop:1520 length:1242 start_codon:yes stop_codon:yes gene_type:complete
MKIIIISPNYYPEEVGCGKFTKELVDWVSKKAKKVIVVTTNPFYPEWKCKYNRYKKSLSGNILVIRCPIYVPKKINGIKRIIHYLSFFITSMPIIIYFAFEDIDFAFNMCPTILSSPNIILMKFLRKLIFRKKLVTLIHYADLEIEAAYKLNYLKNKFLKKILLFFEKEILKNFDLITSVSLNMIEKIKLKTSKNKKIFHFPDYIDTKKFNNLYSNQKINPYAEELAFKGDKFVIMYSGSINEKMACQTLINSIKNLSYRRDLIWIICGDGPKRIFLERNLKDFEHVLFYDFQPFNMVPYWLDVGDIHLIPHKLSSVDFCLPSKLLGILAIGKPVIGIAPLNSELGNLLDNYGIRLASEDSEEMSNAIIKIIEDKKLRCSLSNKGKIFIERFYEKETVLNKMYEEVINQISLG